MTADGFNNKELIFKKMQVQSSNICAHPARPPACRDGGRLSSLRPRASAACQWRVIKKLSYQHQKEMKKLMRNVGLKCPLKKYEEMFDDEFREKVRSASALSVCRCIARAPRCCCC